MSNNDYNNRNFKKIENTEDTFNLSQEEIMNCFGSQIAPQTKSNNDKSKDKKPFCDYYRAQIKPPTKSGISKKELDKDNLIRNICHEFIDTIFSQKKELKGIKKEIVKLQDIIIRNMANSENVNDNNSLNNIGKIRNQQYMNDYQNNNLNNDDSNYSFKKTKDFFGDYNYKSNLDDINKQNKRSYNMPNTKIFNKSRSKSSNTKPIIQEIVPEEDEENHDKKKKNYEKNEAHNNKENIKVNERDPFMSEDPEENKINFDEIKDDEFDEILKMGKNRNNKNKILENDPFQKSSELKRRPNSREKEEECKNNNLDTDSMKKEKGDNNFDNALDIEDENNNNNTKNKNNNDGMIDLDVDEMQSDFMAGGKKISVKLNDNIRQKLAKEITSLDETKDILVELSKNKKKSNIIHNNSKLSCSSNVLSKNKSNDLDSKTNNNNKGMIMNSKKKSKKRNYNTMLENSIKKGKENGSSEKERRKFTKMLKKYSNSNQCNLIKNMDINMKEDEYNLSLANSQNIKICPAKKITKNKGFVFKTIKTCEFYCLCQKKNYLENNDINLIENSKCQICKNSGIIDIHNFAKGFYYYVLNNKEDISEIKISDNNFKLLQENIEEMEEKNDSNQTKKDLIKFFNYQFIFLAYDQYLKIKRGKKKTSEIQIENLLEDIYSKLVNKYKYVFEKGERSYLTQVSEGDSNFGYNNISLLLMNISNGSESSNEDKVIEFSDGYKSCFSVINPEDPINQLLNKCVLRNWMNVEIGMSKVVQITEDFTIFMKFYYNSISASENTDINEINYGPLFDKKKFLPKNILELRNDGGEISLINVIIVKKYDFYINNITKKQSYCRKRYENEMLRIPDSGYKNNNNISESGEKNNRIEKKEPDTILFHFKAIAMDLEIYNTLKKDQKFRKNLDTFLKKRYNIDFFVRYQEIYEMIQEKKIYQLMYLNLESKNNSSNNNRQSINNKNKGKFYYNDFSKKPIQIKFNDKSQINENPLNINYNSDNDFIESMDLINKSLKLTNNIDIGKLFNESEENKPFDNENYLNKEFLITGIFSGYLDKKVSRPSSENNDQSETNNEKEYLERYIFLSIGISKIAIIKLHKNDFFVIEVNSNSINDKIFNCSDILFTEMVYFDNENNQPKITGKQKMNNSIPLLFLKTNNYSYINYGFSKDKAQLDLYTQYQDKNKELVEMVKEAIK